MGHMDTHQVKSQRDRTLQGGGNSHIKKAYYIPFGGYKSVLGIFQGVQPPRVHSRSF